MNTELLKIIPVLPSADIARDISWYKEKAGFETYFSDNMFKTHAADMNGIITGR